MKLNLWRRRTGGWLAVLLLVGIALLLNLSAGVQAATVGPLQNVSQDPVDSLVPRVAQDPNGNVHVVWDTTENSARKVRWRKGTWNGSGYTFGPSVVLADVGAFQYARPAIAVAPNGTVLAAWSKDFKMFVQSWNMNDAQPGGTAAEIMPGFDASIGVDSNNRFHIIGNGDFFVQYCDWNGSSCLKRDAFLKDLNANPDVAVDSSNGVHVVTAGQGINYRYRPAGGEWNNVEKIAPGGNAPNVAADGQGGVHIVWSQDYDVQYCRKTAAGCIDKRALNGNEDLSPSVGATPEGSVVVMFYDRVNKRMWTVARENGTWGNPQNIQAGSNRPDLAPRTYTNRVSGVWSLDYEIAMVTVGVAGTPPPTPTPLPPTPTPIPPVSGSLTVNGGAAFTNQASVNVSITRTSPLPATSYSIADDADPGAPSTAFADPTMTLPFTLNVADGQCRPHTVTAKLAGSVGVSPAFNDTIIYDPSAKGDVTAQNPNSPLNQPLNAIGNALVPTGERAYTRVERLTIMITRPVDECSGLKRYAILPHTVGAATPAADSAAWKDVPTEGYISALIQFNARVGQGTYEFDVFLEDQIGNISATPYTTSIIYDTEAPTVSGERSGLSTSSSPKGGIAAVSVGSRIVNDNLYPGAGEGQEYWGSWVVVKQTSAGAPTAEEWDRYGQIMPGPVPDQMSWNMAYGMVDSFQPGSYTVYIRLLDGAGNGSEPLQSQPVQVSQLEYQRFAPMIQR